VIDRLNKYQNAFNDYKIKSENDLMDILKRENFNSTQINYIDRYTHNVDVYHEMIKKVKEYTENFYDKLENSPDSTQRKKEALDQVEYYYSCLEATRKELRRQEKDLA